MQVAFRKEKLRETQDLKSFLKVLYWLQLACINFAVTKISLNSSCFGSILAEKLAA